MTQSSGSSSEQPNAAKAWDDLYMRADSPVWGEPVPYIVKLVNGISSNLEAEARILDAGTGQGRHLPLLVNTGASIYACDASSTALQRLKAAIDSVQVEVCELSETPFEDSFFDLILLNDVFETLPDPTPVLSEMRRLLRPDGKLICNIPDSDDSVASENMAPLPDGGFLYNNEYYYRFWNQEEAFALFEKHNLEIVSSEAASWQEGPHPGFRNESHTHTSRFLVAKRREL